MDLQTLMEKLKLQCDLCSCPKAFYVGKRESKVSVKHTNRYYIECYPVHRHPKLCYYHLAEERKARK